MKSSIKILSLVFFWVLAKLVSAQHQTIPYKAINDSTNLYLEVLYPENMDTLEKHSAVVFFFGGGWKTGNRSQFQHQAEYLASRGMICFLADYRTASEYQTTPFESLKDAKSTMRFVRKNAAEFGVDPDKIVASGGSAGGHLAAATAMISGFNDADDDLSISCVPNAMVLFNPVIDNGPAGYGYDRMDEAYKEFSPFYNIQRGLPPSIIFLGTKDKLIPVETAEYFKVAMEKVGNRCELKLYEGQGHGFFNFQNTENFNQTMKETVVFLESIGFID